MGFRGNCRVKKYTFPIDKSEAYFTDKFIGGLSKLANKCPIPIEDKTNNAYYSGSCRKGTYRSYQLVIEKICPECSCFMSNLVPIRKINDQELVDNTSDNRKNRNLKNKSPKNMGNIGSNIDFTFSTISSPEINLPPVEKVNKKEEKISFKFKQINRNLNKLDNNNLNEDEDNDNDLNEKVHGNNKQNYRTKDKSEFENLKKSKKDLIPVFTEEDYKAMCFEFKCHNYDLFVLIDEKEYKCINNKVVLENFKGEIVCPPSEIICGKKYLCKFGCTEKYHN